MRVPGGLLLMLLRWSARWRLVGVVLVPRPVLVWWRVVAVLPVLVSWRVVAVLSSSGLRVEERRWTW